MSLVIPVAFLFYDLLRCKFLRQLLWNRFGSSIGNCFVYFSGNYLEISVAISFWSFGRSQSFVMHFLIFFRFVVIPLNRHGNLQTALKLTFVILLKFIQQLFLEHSFDYVLIISWTVPSGIRITTYLEIQTIKKMVIYNRKNAQMNGGRKFKRPIL